MVSSEPMPRRTRSNPVASRLGAIIRHYRVQRGFTLPVLARRAGISAIYLGHLERGQNIPTITLFIELAEVLGLDPGELLNQIAPKRAVAPPPPPPELLD